MLYRLNNKHILRLQNLYYRHSIHRFRFGYKRKFSHFFVRKKEQETFSYSKRQELCNKTFPSFSSQNQSQIGIQRTVLESVCQE